MQTARFNIDLFGTPIMKFESEVVISDQLDENNSVIIRSGFAELKPTLILAADILNILNEKTNN